MAVGPYVLKNKSKRNIDSFIQNFDRQAVEVLKRRFTSTNTIPVERARITLEEKIIVSDILRDMERNIDFVLERPFIHPSETAQLKRHKDTITIATIFFLNVEIRKEEWCHLSEVELIIKRYGTIKEETNRIRSDVLKRAPFEPLEDIKNAMRRL